MLIDKQNRNNCFDLIRFLAAFAVLYSHSFPTSGLAEPTFFAGETLGSLGVFIFFAVSGYLVQQSWDRRPESFAFLISRALRIFPGLIVCLFLCAFILGPAVTKFTTSEYFLNSDVYKFIFSNLTMLFVQRYDALPGVFTANVFPNNINSSLWTIRFEVFMYLSLLLVCVLVKKNRPAVLMGAVFLSCCIYVYGKQSGLSSPGVLLWRLGVFGIDGRILKLAPFFLVGALIAYVPAKYIRISAALFLMLISTLFYASEYGIIFLWFSLPYCVIVFAYSMPGVLNRFGHKGDFSYGMYLYAFPIQQLLSHLEVSTQSWLSGLLITFVGTLFCAILSWRFVEKPALALRSRLQRPVSPHINPQRV